LIDLPNTHKLINKQHRIASSSCQCYRYVVLQAVSHYLRFIYLKITPLTRHSCSHARLIGNLFTYTPTLVSFSVQISLCDHFIQTSAFNFLFIRIFDSKQVRQYERTSERIEQQIGQEHQFVVITDHYRPLLSTRKFVLVVQMLRLVRTNQSINRSILIINFIFIESGYFLMYERRF
jgi:hypothetical protein